MNIRALDPIRPALRDALQSPVGGAVEVQADGRSVIIELTRDGVSSHLLRVRAGDHVLFDCGGMGVAGLTDESLAFMLVKVFRALRSEVKPS